MQNPFFNEKSILQPKTRFLLFLIGKYRMNQKKPQNNAIQLSLLRLSLFSQKPIFFYRIIQLGSISFYWHLFGSCRWYTLGVIQKRKSSKRKYAKCAIFFSDLVTHTSIISPIFIIKTFDPKFCVQMSRYNSNCILLSLSDI